MTATVPRVLVADDEDSIRWVLSQAIAELGWQVDSAANGQEAWSKLRDGRYDIALVDIRMPGVDGLELLSRVRDAGCPTSVVIVTAQNTMANAIEAMKRGAYDYITKPFDLEQVRLLLQRAMEMRRQSAELQRLEQDQRKRFELGVEIVGRTPAMQEIFKTIGRVAATDATVLIQGESGTGKELIARAIHAHSRRWSGPFVAVNCSAVPRDLLESELFGHERGAFTGATEQRPGVFEVANEGTLFLDEVGDMPLELQAKLLRVLQERELTRVGGRDVIKINVRLIAATNQNLERAVREGKFREDLYFRLAVVPIQVPPLRQRRADIPELVRYFLEKINRELGTHVSGISDEALTKLADYSWPGNVRELENTLIRAAVLAPGPLLMPDDLMIGEAPRKPVASEEWTLEAAVRRAAESFLASRPEPLLPNLYSWMLQRVERPLIELALERTGGNQLRAAALLGINRNTLHKKMRQLHIALGRADAQDDK
ncbi:MAG: acetoacetate metabolism regulatory protein AtoC [Candidatus Binatia bacterium]|nr:MAG: acetoacetate metabolism regulatory protein AtoC [Candidatus Binatia bacterium]